MDTTAPKTVESQHNITCSKDVQLTKLDTCNLPFLSQVINPFISQTPKAILERQYLVYDSSITPVWAGATLDFPLVLQQILTVQKALSSFYYMHADVEVSIKINSTPYHQGLMMASFVHDTHGEALNTVQLCAYNPVTFNYSSSQCADIKYHWMCPDFYCTAQAEGGSAHAIGTLYLAPLVPLSNTTGGTTTIPITVYARFLNVQTAGYVVQAEAQMGDKFPVIPSPIPVSQEQQEKSETGLTIASASRNILMPILKSIPVVGDIVQTISSVAKGAADFFDKPRNLNIAMPMLHRYGTDLASAAGQDNSDRLSLYPVSNLATGQVFPQGCSNTSWSATQMAGIPYLHELKDFENKLDKLSIGVDPYYKGYFQLPADGVSYTPDFLSYITSIHKYWRGSIKYYLQFITNAFTTARFRISYVLDGSNPELLVGGDFPSKIVEVKGTTELAIAVPFLWYNAYKRTVPLTEPENYPQMVIQMITQPINFGGNAPQITCVVWRSGGDDMQFMGPQAMNIEALIPSAEAQTSIYDKFSAPFETIGCGCHFSVESGYVSSETTGPLIDLQRRYVYFDGTNGTTMPRSLIDPVINPAKPYKNLYYAIGNMFKYYRGSVRVKQEFDETLFPTAYISQRGYLGTNAAYDINTGATMTVTKHNPWTSIEMPYVSSKPYHATNLDTYATMEINEPVQPIIFTPSVTTLIAAGDDFRQFYHLHMPTFTADPGSGLTTTSMSQATTVTTILETL